MLEILQFITNLDPSEDLGDDKNLVSLCKTAKAKNDQLGGRGKQMVLPVNWRAAGVYALQQSASGDILIRKGGVSHQVPPTKVQGLDFQELFIELSYSEQRAYLTATSRPSMKEPCMMLVAASFAKCSSDSDNDRPDTSPDMHDNAGSSRGKKSSKRSLGDHMAPVVGIARDASPEAASPSAEVASTSDASSAKIEFTPPAKAETSSPMSIKRPRRSPSASCKSESPTILAAALEVQPLPAKEEAALAEAAFQPKIT